jgi:hypothetical protein
LECHGLNLMYFVVFQSTHFFLIPSVCRHMWEIEFKVIVSYGGYMLLLLWLIGEFNGNWFVFSPSTFVS